MCVARPGLRARLPFRRRSSSCRPAWDSLSLAVRPYMRHDVSYKATCRRLAAIWHDITPKSLVAVSQGNVSFSVPRVKGRIRLFQHRGERAVRCASAATKSWRAAMPDLNVTVERTVAGRDLVAGKRGRS